MTQDQTSKGPELSNAQKRQKALQDKESIDEAIELFHQREKVYEELHEVMRNNWEPTQKRLEEADMQFEKMDEFHELQLELQELEWEQAANKRRRENLEPLKQTREAVVKQSKQRG